MSFSIGCEEFNGTFFQLESPIMYFFHIFEVDGYRKFFSFYSRQLWNMKEIIILVIPYQNRKK